MLESTETDFGSYRVLGLLGHGGVGSVYRAEDLRSGLQVAVKTLERPMAAFLPTLRREISALARLRHPGIVQILDSGVRSGVPWYAMELLEGQGLMEHCRGRPLAESLGCVRRLCGALAYLHGEGLVHRDIKPDNILLRNFEFSVSNSELERHSAQRAEIQNSKLKIQNPVWPVLVDFGLAVHSAAAHSREALETDAGVSGTLLYMPPEQLRGELLDARADLYSLGCLIYELLAGRPPFRDASAGELARSHLHEVPEPPSTHEPAVPQPLDALVMGLLAKAPRDRLGHADDVAAALAPFCAPDGRPEARPRAYLYRPELAGRDEALQQFEAHLRRLESGQGGMVLLGGESGVGKSRLALELGRKAGRLKMRVLGGECLPGGATEAGAVGSAGPLHPLRQPLQAVADRCRGRGKAETARLLGRRAKLLALYEPALEGLPGQESLEDAGARGAAPLPPEAARLRLYEALDDTFSALAAEGPLLLLLDDLHWADGLTLGWLEHLARGGRLQRLRLLVVATYRSEERGEPIDLLLGVAGVAALRLERLGEEAVGQIVSDMLALSQPPPLFVRFLARHSEGNPFFVSEYLRAAIAEGVLRRDRKGRWQVGDEDGEPPAEEQYEALPLPRSLHETVARRFLGLSSEARGLATCAAVLGRETEAGLLLALAGVAEEAAWAPLEELRVREVLEEPGPGRLRFAHDKLREVAYAAVPEPGRQALHRRAAEALESQAGPRREAQAAVLGLHWERAGVLERARPAYLEAARHARDRWALEEAGRHYRAYLALDPAPGPESLAARDELAQDVLRAGGRLGEAEAEQQRVLEEARRQGLRGTEALSLRRLAALKQDRGSPEAARGLLEQALQLHRELGERRETGIDLGNLALTYQDLGEMEEAKDLFHRALAIHQEEGNRRSEATVLGNLGSLHFMQGRIDEALRLYERAVDLHREMGNRWQEGIYLTSVANVYHQSRQWERAQALYQQALQLLREIGTRRDEGNVLSHMALMTLEQGRLDAAAPLLREALEIHRDVGDAKQEGFTLTHFAVLRMSQGRIQEARAFLDEAVALLRKPGFARIEAMALMSLAILLRRCGGPRTEMEDALGRVDALGRKIGDTVLLGACLCEQGRMSLAAGRSARRQMEEAAGLLAQLGGKSGEGLQEDLERLQRAEAAFEAAGPLFRGELLEDLPAGLLQALREAGHLA